MLEIQSTNLTTKFTGFYVTDSTIEYIENGWKKNSIKLPKMYLNTVRNSIKRIQHMDYDLHYSYFISCNRQKTENVPLGYILLHKVRDFNKEYPYNELLQHIHEIESASMLF